jgi:hypothetical protein
MTGQDLIDAFGSWVKSQMEEYGTNDVTRELGVEDKEQIAGEVESFIDDQFSGDDVEEDEDGDDIEGTGEPSDV